MVEWRVSTHGSPVQGVTWGTRRSPLEHWEITGRAKRFVTPEYHRGRAPHPHMVSQLMVRTLPALSIQVSTGHGDERTIM